MSNSGKNNKADIGLRVEEARTFDEINKYADAWNNLALNAPQQHPALTHAWMSAFLKSCVKEGESWFCLFAFDNDDLVGVLPLLAREYKLLWNKYLSLRTPKGTHTLAVDFLFKEKYGQSVIQLFANYLNKIRPRVIRLTMNKIAYNSPTFGILEEGIHGIYSSYYPNGYTSVIPVEGSFNDYKNKLSKNHKRNVRRRINRLQKIGNISVTVIDSGNDAQKNLLSFADIEHSGWKGQVGTTIKYKFWAFFEEFVRKMDENGMLKWYFLNVKDKRIAGCLSIPFGRSVIVLKTCYDEQYHSFSPGIITTMKMIENIFSNGEYYEVINLLTDFEWHSHWKVERKPYYHMVIAFNHPLSIFTTRLPYAIYSRYELVRKLKGIISRFT